MKVQNPTPRTSSAFVLGLATADLLFHAGARMSLVGEPRDLGRRPALLEAL
jgi:hypothetical protein